MEQRIVITISFFIVFLYWVCMIIVVFSVFFSCTCVPRGGVQWISTMLKVTWNPEWNVILRSVGRYHKAFDSRSWYVRGFSPRLVLLRHVSSRELIRHSCCDDMGSMPVGKSGSLHIFVSVYSELCGTQRVESLKCGNEFTLKVYGYQLHNGQLRQRHM